jgi:hypothetical protein
MLGDKLVDQAEHLGRSVFGRLLLGRKRMDLEAHQFDLSKRPLQERQNKVILSEIDPKTCIKKVHKVFLVWSNGVLEHQYIGIVEYWSNGVLG